eukprot:gnl/MRDRNA2_/MRDRNA2_115441_c0_seq1.p1 gnl/MRDRNA2_/MRDRNA2_115441_c0~~gnl/MRDRNA2_/MRDRNA2_115441_c0_seq1.p1  ORF type:complete len:452 (+),score=139.38 gnl/MRDRNA2_/MRDRNA2_115441_c0_seq1:185-1357(+)
MPSPQQQQHPEEEQEAPEILKTTDVEGRQRTGRFSDVSTVHHWVLVPCKEGYWEMCPVASWFSFGPPEVEVTGQKDPDKQMKLAELELKLRSKERHANEDRWDRMAQRMRGVVHGADEEIGAEDAGANSSGIPQNADRSIQTRPDGRIGRIGDTGISTAEVEEEDEVGAASEVHRKMRQLQRERDESENLEDKETPDAAGAILGLKNQEGEWGWDYEDDEQHSDDEERHDVDLPVPMTQDVDALADESDVAPSADSEDDADGDDDALMEHGQRIKHLLKQHVVEEKSSLSTEQEAELLQAQGLSAILGGASDVESGDEAGGSAPQQKRRRLNSSTKVQQRKRPKQPKQPQPQQPQRPQQSQQSQLPKHTPQLQQPQQAQQPQQTQQPQLA